MERKCLDDTFNNSKPRVMVTSKATFTTQQQEQMPIAIIPPNLRIDPKSSFASNIVTPDKLDMSLLKPVLKISSRSSREGKTQYLASRPKPSEVTEDNSNVEVDETEEYDGDDDDDENDEVSKSLSLLYAENITFAKPLPDRLKIDIHTLFAPQYSNVVGSIHLDAGVFGCDPIRVDLLKRAVDYYRAKKRGIRKAHTKTIAEVSGSGRKIRQQKGTGKARVGHKRPPQFRGGAKAHGPNKHQNTDYSNIKLNKKVRQMALRNALSQKLKEGNFILLNELHTLPTHRTNDLVKLLAQWDISTKSDNSSSALIIDHYYPSTEDTTAALSYRGVPANLHVASTNLHQVKIGNDNQVTVYDLLKYDKIIMTLAALTCLEQRLRID